MNVHSASTESEVTAKAKDSGKQWKPEQVFTVFADGGWAWVDRTCFHRFELKQMQAFPSSEREVASLVEWHKSCGHRIEDQRV